MNQTKHKVFSVYPSWFSGDSRLVVETTSFGARLLCAVNGFYPIQDLLAHEVIAECEGPARILEESDPIWKLCKGVS